MSAPLRGRIYLLGRDTEPGVAVFPLLVIVVDALTAAVIDLSS